MTITVSYPEGSLGVQAHLKEAVTETCQLMGLQFPTVNLKISETHAEIQCGEDLAEDIFAKTLLGRMMIIVPPDVIQCDVDGEIVSVANATPFGTFDREPLTAGEAMARMVYLRTQKPVQPKNFDEVQGQVLEFVTDVILKQKLEYWKDFYQTHAAAKHYAIQVMLHSGDLDEDAVMQAEKTLNELGYKIDYGKLHNQTQTYEPDSLEGEFDLLWNIMLLNASRIFNQGGPEAIKEAKTKLYLNPKSFQFAIADNDYATLFTSVLVPAAYGDVLQLPPNLFVTDCNKKAPTQIMLGATLEHFGLKSPLLYDKLGQLAQKQGSLSNPNVDQYQSIYHPLLSFGLGERALQRKDIMVPLDFIYRSVLIRYEAGMILAAIRDYSKNYLQDIEQIVDVIRTA